MSDVLDLGEPGNCLSCSKHRENVVGESCIDCLVYYGSASPSLRIAVEHGIKMYRRGYVAAVLDAKIEADRPAAPTPQ